MAVGLKDMALVVGFFILGSQVWVSNPCIILAAFLGLSAIFQSPFPSGDAKAEPRLPEEVPPVLCIEVIGLPLHTAKFVYPRIEVALLLTASHEKLIWSWLSTNSL